MATDFKTLHGSCACGRNRYVVEVPIEKAQLAEICYDNTAASRNTCASPITFWLRVPLPWYTSATFAQFDDETRSSIQRSFTSPFATNARRQFCGYCGTQLTSWNERTPEEAEHICVSVGSLLGEDQDMLAKLGFLPDDNSSEEDADEFAGPSKLRSIIRSEPQARGAPWFEELVEKTRLGRIKQQRGGHSAHGGRVMVEWEVVEWTGADDGDQGDASPSKRKFGDVEGDNTMTNV